MRIAVARETHPAERRVSLLPDGVRELCQLGARVSVESGLGSSLAIADGEYLEAGAQVVSERFDLLAEAELVLGLRKPSMADVSSLRPSTIHVSFLDPFQENELVARFAAQGVSALSMEMIPRSTRAQKMDALSSQASLAGYVAVILAASELGKIFPMMTTPAGTIAPARVFVIGAGVAGLQAIATAKRLGARVEAHDTRPVVEEEVKSLGARFVHIDLGKTGQTRQGYAKALSEEQLDFQRREMKRYCARADIVITTAQLFGRPAPRIVSREMLSAMKPGSVVVDLAVESGGNVEGSEADRVVNVHNVRVVGLTNLPGRVPWPASQVYSNNLVALVKEFWNSDRKRLGLDRQDEIIAGCLVTHDREIVNPKLLEVIAAV